MISLRRSCVRKRITEYLYDIYPDCTYVSDIAFKARTQPIHISNAMGSRGKKSSKYSDEYSLLNLGIIEEIKYKKNQKMYRITDFGIFIIKKLHDKYGEK